MFCFTQLSIQKNKLFQKVMKNVGHPGRFDLLVSNTKKKSNFLEKL